MKMIRQTVAASLGLVFIGSAVFAQSLNDAKKAIDAEQYQKAKSMLNTLVTTQPQNAENFFYLGDAYLKTDHADSARIAYNKGIAANANYTLNYVGLGTADLMEKNASGAKSNFDKAISLAGKKDYLPFIYIGKAYTREEGRDLNAANENLQKALAINPKDAEVYLALGDMYAVQFKNTDAVNNYEKALEFKKDALRAKVQIGWCYGLARAFQEADDKFKEVIALDANYGPTYRELAELYHKWGDFDVKNYKDKQKQAVDFYKKYIDLTDKSTDSRIRYASFLFYAGDFQGLQQETSALVAQGVKTPILLRLKGYSAFENGNVPVSLQTMKDFFASNPPKVIGRDYLYLGKAQLQTPGQENEAIPNILKAVQMDSTNADALPAIAKSLYAAKKYTDAAALYEKVMANPKVRSTLLDVFQLGQSYYYDYATKLNNKQNPAKDNLVKADSAFAQVFQKSPNTVIALIMKARTEQLMDDETQSQAKAAPTFEKYISVAGATPELAEKNKAGLVEAYLYLASVSRVKGDTAKAKEYTEKAKTISPNDPDVQAALDALNPKPAAKPAPKKGK